MVVPVAFYCAAGFNYGNCSTFYRIILGADYQPLKI